MEQFIYQIRDIRGRKRLERSDPEEIKYWLQKQLGRDYEVWHLDASPGELKKIVTASQFILENEKSKP